MRASEAEFVGDQDMRASNITYLITRGVDITPVSILLGRFVILL